MAHDHAVADIVEERRQHLRLVASIPALIPGHAVHGHRAGVLGDLDQRVEGILEHDLSPLDGDRSHGDQPIYARVQAGRL